MHKYLCLLVMGAGIVLGSRPAVAQIINYTLSGVTFAGGGTATGGFSWDSGLNGVTSGSITFDGKTDIFHSGIRTYSVLTSVSYAGNQFIHGVSAHNQLDFAFEATDLGVSGPHLITVGRAVSSSPSVGLASTEFGWFAHNIFDPVTAGGS